jgi:hypothetical protein
MMAILDAGLAAKYVRALAKADPAAYGAAAEQLEAKAERIRRRRKESARQGLNKRTGRGRTINEYNV